MNARQYHFDSCHRNGYYETRKAGDTLYLFIIFCYPNLPEKKSAECNLNEVIIKTSSMEFTI